MSQTGDKREQRQQLRFFCKVSHRKNGSSLATKTQKLPNLSRSWGALRAKRIAQPISHALTCAFKLGLNKNAKPKKNNNKQPKKLRSSWLPCSRVCISRLAAEGVAVSVQKKATAHNSQKCPPKHNPKCKKYEQPKKLLGSWLLGLSCFAAATESCFAAGCFAATHTSKACMQSFFSTLLPSLQHFTAAFPTAAR